MAFWGCEVKPGGKPTPFVPPPTDDGHSPRLHLSQVIVKKAACGIVAAASHATGDWFGIQAKAGRIAMAQCGSVAFCFCGLCSSRCLY